MLLLLSSVDKVNMVKLVQMLLLVMYLFPMGNAWQRLCEGGQTFCLLRLRTTSGCGQCHDGNAVCETGTVGAGDPPIPQNLPSDMEHLLVAYNGVLMSLTRLSVPPLLG